MYCRLVSFTYHVVASWKSKKRGAHLNQRLNRILESLKLKRGIALWHTSAMSSLIPFGRFLKVGGKSENIAKLIVVAAEPELGWTKTTKLLSRFAADFEGFNFK